MSSAIERWNSEAIERLNPVLDELDDVPYPFDHAMGSVSVTDSMLRWFKPDNGQSMLFDPVWEFAPMIYELTVLVTGRLGQIAEIAEEALGLEPLPEPPSSSEDET